MSSLDPDNDFSAYNPRGKLSEPIEDGMVLALVFTCVVTGPGAK